MSLFLRAPMSFFSKLTENQLFANLESLWKKLNDETSAHTVHHLTRDVVTLEVSKNYGDYNSPFLIIKYYFETGIIQISLTDIRYLISENLNLVLCFPKEDFINLLELATLVKGTYILMNTDVMFKLTLDDNATKLNQYLMGRDTFIAKEFENNPQKVLEELRYKLRMSGNLDYEVLLKRELFKGITIGELLPVIDVKYPGFTNEYRLYHERTQYNHKEEEQLSINMNVTDLHYIVDNLPSMFEAFGGLDFAKTNIEHIVKRLTDSTHTLILSHIQNKALVPLYVEALEKYTKLKDEDTCTKVDERT